MVEILCDLSKIHSKPVSGHGAVPGMTVPCDKNNQFLPMGRIQPIANKASKNKEKEEISADTTENMRPGAKHPSLTVVNNINLTEPEKEMLRWHQRLGHISVRKRGSIGKV